MSNTTTTKRLEALLVGTTFDVTLTRRHEIGDRYEVTVRNGSRSGVMIVWQDRWEDWTIESGSASLPSEFWNHVESGGIEAHCREAADRHDAAWRAAHKDGTLVNGLLRAS